MKVSIAFVLFLCVFCFSSPAQSSYYNTKPESKHLFGFTGGIGLSTITGLKAVEIYGLPGTDYSIQGFSSGYKFMFDMGFVYQYEKTDKYFLQTNAIFFNTTGAKIDGVSKKYESDIDAINVGGLLFHLLGGKKINIKNNTKIIAGAGPCIYVDYAAGYGGSGEIIYYDNGDYEESIVVGGESPDVNLFGLGMNAIIGIETDNWQIGVIGDYGLTKVFKDSRFKSYHKSIKLSITYFL